MNKGSQKFVAGDFVWVWESNKNLWCFGKIKKYVNTLPYAAVDVTYKTPTQTEVVDYDVTLLVPLSHLRPCIESNKGMLTLTNILDNLSQDIDFKMYANERLNNATKFYNEVTVLNLLRECVKNKIYNTVIGKFILLHFCQQNCSDHNNLFELILSIFETLKVYKRQIILFYGDNNYFIINTALEMFQVTLPLNKTGNLISVTHVKTVLTLFSIFSEFYVGDERKSCTTFSYEIMLSQNLEQFIGLKFNLNLVNTMPFSNILDNDTSLPKVIYYILHHIQDIAPYMNRLTPFQNLPLIAKYLPENQHFEEFDISLFSEGLHMFLLSNSYIIDLYRILYIIICSVTIYRTYNNNTYTELNATLKDENLLYMLSYVLKALDAQPLLEILVEVNCELYLRLATSLYYNLIYSLVNRMNDYFINHNIKSPLVIEFIGVPDYIKTCKTLHDIIQNVYIDIITQLTCLYYYDTAFRFQSAPNSLRDKYEIIRGNLEKLNHNSSNKPETLFGLIATISKKVYNTELAESEKAIKIKHKFMTKIIAKEFQKLKNVLVKHPDSYELKPSGCFLKVAHTYEVKKYQIFQSYILDNNMLIYPATFRKLFRRFKVDIIFTLVSKSTIMGYAKENSAVNIFWNVIDSINQSFMNHQHRFPCLFYTFLLQDKRMLNYNLYYEILKRYIDFLYLITNETFPVVYTYREFYIRYNVLSNIYHTDIPTNEADLENNIKKLLCLMRCDFKTTKFSMGKVFLSLNVYLKLEEFLSSFHTQFLPNVIKLQNFCRRLNAYSKLRRFRRAIISLQSELRRIKSNREVTHLKKHVSSVAIAMALFTAYKVKPLEDLPKILETDIKVIKKVRNQYNEDAAIFIQAWWRQQMAVKKAVSLQIERCKLITGRLLTMVCRRYLAQRQILEAATSTAHIEDCVVIIQKHVRGWIVRRRYRELMALKAAILPIKRVAGRLLTLQSRLHMRVLLSRRKGWRSKHLNERLIQNAATTIQKCWKAYCVRTQYAQLKKAAIACTNVANTIYQQYKFQILKKQTIRIQRWWKAYLVLKRYNILPLLQRENFLKLDKTSEQVIKNRESQMYKYIWVPMQLYQGFQLIQRENSFLILSFRAKNLCLSHYYRGWSYSLYKILSEKAKHAAKVLDLVNVSYFKPALEDLQEILSNRPLLDHYCEDYDTLACDILSVFPQLFKVQSIVAGSNYSLIMLKEPESINSNFDWITNIYSWGSHKNGQLGRYHSNNNPIEACFTRLEFYSAINTKHQIESVHAGHLHCVALSESGLVFCWGDNRYGQCAQPVVHLTIPAPKLIKYLRSKTIEKASVGMYQTMVLSHHGSVFVWGSSVHLGLDLYSKAPIYYPLQLDFENKLIRDIYCSYRFSIVLAAESKSEALVWGINSTGQLGINTNFKPTKIRYLHVVDIPKNPSVLLRIEKLSCGKNYVCAIVKPAYGRVFLWGLFYFTNPVVVNPNTQTKLPNTFKTLRKGVLDVKLKSTLPVTATEKPPTRVKKIIPVPNAVIHPLWERQNDFIDVICGYKPHITVLNSKHIIHSFDEVSILWISKPAEPQTINQPKPLLIKKTLYTPVNKSTKGKRYNVVSGLYQLEANLYGYRRCSSRMVCPTKLMSSHNSNMSIECVQATCRKLDDEISRRRIIVPKNQKNLLEFEPMNQSQKNLSQPSKYVFNKPTTEAKSKTAIDRKTLYFSRKAVTPKKAEPEPAKKEVIPIVNAMEPEYKKNFDDFERLQNDKPITGFSNHDIHLVINTARTLLHDVSTTTASI